MGDKYFWEQLIKFSHCIPVHRIHQCSGCRNHTARIVENIGGHRDTQRLQCQSHNQSLENMRKNSEHLFACLLAADQKNKLARKKTFRNKLYLSKFS